MHYQNFTRLPGAFLLLVALVWLGFGARVPAGPFTSVQVFGDGLCTTTDNVSTAAPFYGNRYCNGRVWIEVLCQWQGLPYDEATNHSYFGQDSDELIENTTTYVAPADVATALFIVWANNADLVEYLNNPATSPPYDDSDIPSWTTFIAQAIANHEQAVTILHNKGARTIVLPTAVDVTAVPRYQSLPAASKAFVRQRVIEFNSAFAASLAGLADALPGLVIHSPDVFSFVDDLIADPARYGVSHPTVSAIIDLYDPGDPSRPALDGPGAQYMWWDLVHPTARVQMFVADLVQREISPLRLAGVGLNGGNTLLSVHNVPLDRTGIVEGRNGPGDWQEDATIFEPFATGSTTTSVSFPTPTPTRLQRIRFPVTWSWP